ncbi:MAG TPA: hypothetical protein VK891_07685 [Euzebyales bacterium]|nr:hypothetical protein [Euzebyales bacterium]
MTAKRSDAAPARCRARAVWRGVAALLVSALVAAACGGAGDTGRAAGAATDGGAVDRSGPRRILRFAFAPDPVWDYLKDTGTLAEWESQHHVRVVDTASWDEFSYFAGGHGDIVSTASYELPLLERETGTRTVTFGKYNHVRNVPLVRPESGFATFADLPDGAKVAASSSVGATVVWGMLIEKLHDRTLTAGAGDFELVVADNALMPELVRTGEVDVCICDPETAARELRTGELDVMYGGQTAQDLYRDVSGIDHFGLMSNMFTATERWYDANPDLVVAWLELWQQGIDLWNRNVAEIVGIYPQHFAVETEEDIEFVIDYLGANDWFVDDVALTREWIDGEIHVYELMQETGFMDSAEEVPRFEVVDVDG